MPHSLEAIGQKQYCRNGQLYTVRQSFIQWSGTVTWDILLMCILCMLYVTTFIPSQVTLSLTFKLKEEDLILSTLKICFYCQNSQHVPLSLLVSVAPTRLKLISICYQPHKAGCWWGAIPVQLLFFNAESLSWEDKRRIEFHSKAHLG